MSATIPDSNDFLGNESAREELRRMFCRPVSGSIILTGPAGVGKYAFIEGLLRNVSIFDKLFIDFETETKHIDRVRDISDFMAVKNAPDTFRTVVARGAHEMSREAQHAFLKTLEELHAGLIILVTDNLSRLLPTIRSRSLIVRFSGVSQNLTEQILLSLGYSGAKIQGTLRFFPNQPGIAKRMLDRSAVAPENNGWRYRSPDRDQFRALLLEEILRLRDELLRFENSPKGLSERIRTLTQLYLDLADYSLNEKIQYANYTRASREY